MIKRHFFTNWAKICLFPEKCGIFFHSANKVRITMLFSCHFTAFFLYNDDTLFYFPPWYHSSGKQFKRIWFTSKIFFIIKPGLFYQNSPVHTGPVWNEIVQKLFLHPIILEMVRNLHKTRSLEVLVTKTAITQSQLSSAIEQLLLFVSVCVASSFSSLIKLKYLWYWFCIFPFPFFCLFCH